MVRGHEKMEERTYEEWMGCQTDGRTDGQKDEITSIGMGSWINGLSHGWLCDQMNGQIDKRKNKRRNRRTDGSTKERTDGRTKTDH